MQCADETLEKIYNRTGGDCHLCHGKVAFSNYGQLGRRGAWEIEHSVPQARGGTNRLNNLYPAHVSCNRSKGTSSSRSIRSRYGKTKAPLSFKERESVLIQRTVLAGVIGGIAGYWISEKLDLSDGEKWLLAIAGAVICGAIAYRINR